MLPRLMNALLLVVGLVLIGMAMPATADPVDAGTPDANIVDMADRDPVGVGVGVIEDARKGNWKLAVAGILSLLIWALKRLKTVTRIFESTRGGAAFVLAVGLLNWFAMTLGAGGSLGLTSLLAGVITTLIAAGGWELVIKRLILGRT